MKKKISVSKTFEGTVDEVRDEIKEGLSKRLEGLTSLKFTDTKDGIRVKGKGFDAEVTFEEASGSVKTDCTVSLGLLLRPFASKIEKELNNL